MGEPGILGGTVPMLYISRDMDDRSGQNLHSGLALLLIPTSAGDSYQHLSTAFRRLMYVPVVAAAGLERHIGKRYLIFGNRRQIAVAGKILGISGIGFAYGENHLTLESRLGIAARKVFIPYVLRKPESGPRLGPTGIESYVGNDFGDFSTGNAVLLRVLQMMEQRRICDTLGNERRDCHKATVAQRQEVVAAPYLAEKDVIVQMSELRSELAEGVASRCLYYFLLCHTGNNCYQA